MKLRMRMKMTMRMKVSEQEKATEGLEEVREKPWAKPLGSALRLGSSVVKNLEGFVPGASILEGALTFGASLLNPETTLEDLKKGLIEIKDVINDDASTKAALNRLVLREKERATSFADAEAKLKENLNQTYNLLVDSRFRVSQQNLDMKCCFLRMGLRPLTLPMKFSCKMASKTSNNFHLS